MNQNFDAGKDMEKRSSAISLSDMEMFIFPDLIYSLMLANIMSPILWEWRNDPRFDGISKRRGMSKINRLKQYIMARYAFNLDLDTWGLTTKEKELARFEGIVDPDMLAQSNALFGYEGDKYYFDLDIRTHFGLDKYEGNVIPYWKTETLEAMTAFYRRPGYEAGAGECVSLSALYAAALFVVLEVPLKDIFMMGTPLHSQNFLDIGDGILTNNRRLVTKNMWFNGTALSAQARRSLENERITLVAHETGAIHIMYPHARISKKAYAKFRKKLSAYLTTQLAPEILGNFLRQSPSARQCFLVRHVINGVERYVSLQRAFEYEHDCPYKVTDNTLPKLLAEMDQEEFLTHPCKEKIIFDDILEYLKQHPVDLFVPEDVNRLRERFRTSCFSADQAMEDLIAFCHTEPRMPEASEKTFLPQQEPLGIVPGMTREAIIERIDSLRDKNEYCRLAFYAYRDLSRTDSAPFMKAAIERNPVCIKLSAKTCPDETSLIKYLTGLSSESIYDSPNRLSQPDEVWNFSTGDGLEKAIMLGVVLHARNERAYAVEVQPGKAILKDADGKQVVEWPTEKIITDKRLVIG